MRYGGSGSGYGKLGGNNTNDAVRRAADRIPQYSSAYSNDYIHSTRKK